MPCFYALKNSVTPAIVSMSAVGLNIALNLWLVRIMGYRGLALGTAIAAIVNAAVLLGLLRRRLGGLELDRVAVAFLKIALASAVMGVCASATHDWLLRVRPDDVSTVARLVRVMTTIGTSLVVLAVSARVLRIHELDQARREVLARVSRTRPR